MDVSKMEKLLEESGLAFGRGLDLCLDIDLLVPSVVFLDVWPRLCRFSFFPIIEKYSLYFVFHSASDKLHDQSEFLDFMPMCRTSTKQRRSAKKSF